MPKTGAAALSQQCIGALGLWGLRPCRGCGCKVTRSDKCKMDAGHILWEFESIYGFPDPQYSAPKESFFGLIVTLTVSRFKGAETKTYGRLAWSWISLLTPPLMNQNRLWYCTCSVLALFMFFVMLSYVTHCLFVCFLACLLACLLAFVCLCAGVCL